MAKVVRLGRPRVLLLPGAQGGFVGDLTINTGSHSAFHKVYRQEEAREEGEGEDKRHPNAYNRRRSIAAVS